MGILDHLNDLARESGESAVEFYPGTHRPIVRHPNRAEPKKPDPSRWDSHSVMLRVGGEPREFFTIGNLAQALDRKPNTIRMWERKGWIPKATYRKPGQTENGVRRLYTRAQIEGLLRIATEEGLMKGENCSVTATNFTERAFALFKELMGK